MKILRATVAGLTLSLLASSAAAQVVANEIDVHVSSSWTMTSSTGPVFETGSFFKVAPTQDASTYGSVSICLGEADNQTACSGNSVTALGLTSSTGGQIAATTVQRSELFFEIYTAPTPKPISVSTRLLQIIGGPAAPTATMDLSAECTLLVGIFGTNGTQNISSTSFAHKPFNSAFSYGTTNGAFNGSAVTDGFIVSCAGDATSTVLALSEESVSDTKVIAQAGADIFLFN